MTSIDPTLTAPREQPSVPWVDADDLALVGDTGGADDRLVAYAIRLAGRVMWAASGRRYGLTRRVLRPYWQGCRYHGSRCYGPHRLRLPGPIAAVEAIHADGVELDQAEYRINTARPHARRALLRFPVDTETWWTCNDPDGDPLMVPANPNPSCPAWQVDYWQGRAVPEEAKIPTAILALNILRETPGGKAASVDDDSNCGTMQPGLARVVRRGVTLEFDTDDQGEKPDPVRGIGAGWETGVNAADRWLQTVNPHGLPHQSRIGSARDLCGPGWSWIAPSQTAVTP